MLSPRSVPYYSPAHPPGALTTDVVAEARSGHPNRPGSWVSSGDHFGSPRLVTLTSSITSLTAAGAAAGTIRPDVDPLDLLAALSGVSLAAGEPAQRAQAGRLLDLLIDGLRYRGTSPGSPAQRSPGSLGSEVSGISATGE